MKSFLFGQTEVCPRGANKWALFQVMVWRRIGDKQLPERMPIQFTDEYMRH